MSAVGTNIRRYREALGLTQNELAQKLNIARSTVTQWENGWSNPRMGMVQKLAGVFGISTSDIVAEDAAVRTPPPNAVMPNHSPRRAYAPLLGRVHAGDAQEPDVLDGRVPIPAEVYEAHPAGYFLLVEGQCMSKVYPEGCFIFIDPEQQPQNGSIAVVSIDGSDYVMRRLYRGASTLVLSPDSWEEGYGDIVVTEDGEHVVEFHGTVVWFQPDKELE